MWPWGHAAVGYLLYSGFERLDERRPPAGLAALLVVFGAQIPDLVDKPLAWSVSVLPTGRSLAHSLLVAGLVLGLVGWLVGTRHRRLVVAAGVGWVSHSLVDGLPSALSGEFAYLGFLLWPVTGTPPYSTEKSFLAHFRSLEPTSSFFVEILLVGVALAVWYRDGRPGVATLWTYLRRRVPSVGS